MCAECTFTERPLLRLEAVDAGYGDSRVLHGLQLHARARSVTALLGRNGVGKTTTLSAVMGLARVTSGSITFDGQELTSLPAYQIPRLGMSIVPQGRHVFPEFTVMENLTIGVLRGRYPDEPLEWVFRMFPVLKERRSQRAGSLSGGEQQMVAIGRALMTRPRMVLMDEPLEGLSPAMTGVVRDAILEVQSAGVTVLLVDQNIDNVLALADEVNVIEKGQVKARCNAVDLRRDASLLEYHLGIRKR